MKTDPYNFQVCIAENPFELIEDCRRGDQKAQLKVYKLYWKPLLSFCMQMVNDPAKAKEIMHESFLQAFENINLYHGNTSFPEWIKNFIKIR